MPCIYTSFPLPCLNLISGSHMISFVHVNVIHSYLSFLGAVMLNDLSWDKLQKEVLRENTFRDGNSVYHHSLNVGTRMEYLPDIEFVWWTNTLAIRGLGVNWILDSFLISCRALDFKNYILKKWNGCLKACWGLNILYGFLREAELLKYRCTVNILAASLQWKGLAVLCSTPLSGCPPFSNFQSCSPEKPVVTGRGLVVIYFVETLHLTCNSSKVCYVQLKHGDGIAKLCTFYVYSCYAPWNLKKLG